MTDGGIIFRVDGSHTLGMGHIVRCLSLADALTTALSNCSVSLPIYFVTKANPAVESLLCNSIAAGNVRVIPEIESGFESLDAIISKTHPNVVIADIDLRGRVSDYLCAIYPGPIAVSLHEHNYGILPGDIVVAPTILPLEIAPGGTIGVTHFTGPDYILLAPEISENRKGLSKIGKPLKIGFVSFGGADPNGLTAKFVDYLQSCAVSSVDWDIVLGPASEYRPDDMQTKYKGRYKFHDGLALGRIGFLDLLSAADLVVTNGGTTLYESLAMGRPTIAISQNDFETDVIRLLAARRVCLDRWETIAELMENPDAGIAMGEKGSHLIDGKGCERVAELILSR